MVVDEVILNLSSSSFVGRIEYGYIYLPQQIDTKNISTAAIKGRRAAESRDVAPESATPAAERINPLDVHIHQLMLHNYNTRSFSIQIHSPP